MLDISLKNFGLVLINIVHELSPKNKELIKFREILQKKIDNWHIENKESKLKFRI